MEAVHHRITSFPKRSNVVASEEGWSSRTDDEEQMGDGDAFLNCFSPLINSMKVFGLYFTQAARRIHDVSSMKPDSAVPKKWNRGRIYAVIILVLAWLNVARMLTVFEKTDKFGYFLLLKLAMVSGGLLSVVLQTACYVACQTGNLDRVFLNARLPKSDHVRYRRLAVIHTATCWMLVVIKLLMSGLPLFHPDVLLSYSMTPFGIHVVVSGPLVVLIKLFAVLQYFVAYPAWLFPQSVNYMVTSVLCDQFRALNKDFHRAVGCGGEFHGSIREFRQRHQALSHSVHKVDQFMMISNVAVFSCQILNLILIFYSSVFFADENVGHNEFLPVIHVAWLILIVISLALAACQGIVINHAVCMYIA